MSEKNELWFLVLTFWISFYCVLQHWMFVVWTLGTIEIITKFLSFINAVVFLFVCYFYINVFKAVIFLFNYVVCFKHLSCYVDLTYDKSDKFTWQSKHDTFQFTSLGKTVFMYVTGLTTGWTHVSKYSTFS